MLHLQDVHKYHAVAKKKLHVLKGVDLLVEDREVVSIFGFPDSGKSTLLNILGILEDYDYGQYILAGTYLKNLSPAQATYYRNKYVGFVSSSFQLLPFQNILENVAMPLCLQKVQKEERNQRALTCLEQVGLADVADRLPHTLTLAERQRTAIARALACAPGLLVADEPTLGLPLEEANALMELFLEISQTGIAVVIGTQQSHIAEQAHRVFHLLDGQLLKVPVKMK